MDSTARTNRVAFLTIVTFLCCFLSQAVGSFALTSGNPLVARQGTKSCNSDQVSCNGICCVVGAVCTPGGCCPEGQTCHFQTTEPCEKGKDDVTCVQCTNDTFACPISRSCSRDSAGKPQCIVAPTVATSTSTKGAPATSTRPGGSQTGSMTGSMTGAGPAAATSSGAGGSSSGTARLTFQPTVIIPVAVAIIAGYMAIFFN